MCLQQARGRGAPETALVPDGWGFWGFWGLWCEASVLLQPVLAHLQQLPRPLSVFGPGVPEKTGSLEMI